MSLTGRAANRVSGSLEPPYGNTGAILYTYPLPLPFYLDESKQMTKDAPVFSDHVDTLRVMLPAEHYYVIRLSEVTEPARARDGYNEAVRTEDGIVWMINRQRPDMGTSAYLDGECCRSLRDRGQFRTIAEHLANIEGSKCQRIDLAVDVADAGVLDLAWTAAEEGRLVTRASRESMSWYKKGNGRTLGVGSRASESYLRIYDKAAEQKLPGEWTRVEIEVKGKRAQPTFRAWLDGVSSASIIADFVRFTDEVPDSRATQRYPASAWWAAVINTPVKVCVHRQKLEKDLVKRMLWVERCVLPSVIEYSENIGWLVENIDTWSKKSLSSACAPAR